MAEKITSESNSKLKLIRKLMNNRRFRDSEKMFAIEGINMVERAVSLGLPIEYIIVSSDFEPEDVRIHFDNVKYPVYIVERRLYERTSQAENGSGIMAVLRKREIPIREIVSSLDESSNMLILDRLQDPGNAGTIIRTAAAASYKYVISIKGTVDIFSPKVLRATAGAFFDIEFIHMDDPPSVISALRDMKKRLAVAVPRDGELYYNTDLRQNIALVIGNEGSGVAEEFLKSADIRVTIPMINTTESLNASVSAGILMYESVRKTNA